MAYATLDQLTTRYTEQLLLQLTDRAVPPAGAIDQAVIDRALADTDAAIDGYLAGRYVLPIGETPPLLADLAQAIAIYKLHPFTPNDKIDKDYRDALASLAAIAKGTIRLPLPGLGAGDEPASSGASGVVTTDREPVMTADSLRGFI